MFLFYYKTFVLKTQEICKHLFWKIMFEHYNKEIKKAVYTIQNVHTAFIKLSKNVSINAYLIFALFCCYS